MENSALARFVKLQGKTSIVEFNFIKVVGQKSDGVINTELFLNVFWKDWQLEVKGNEFFLKFHHFFPSRILPNKFFSPLKTLPVEHIFPSRN